MSQENVELIRAAAATYNAGDLDAHLALYAPDAQWVPDTSTFPEAAPPHGRDEIRRFIEGTRGGFMNLRYELSEVFAVGADRVLARGEWADRERPAGSRRIRASPRCGPFATARSPKPSSSSTTMRPSKPWGCRSKMPRPAAADRDAAAIARITVGRSAGHGCGRNSSPRCPRGHVTPCPRVARSSTGRAW